MQTTNMAPWGDVILTAGAIDGHSGRQIIGVFRDADDARSMDADSLALATVAADTLTTEQLAVAEQNSAEMC